MRLLEVGLDLGPLEAVVLVVRSVVVGPVVGFLEVEALLSPFGDSSMPE